jgi:hypothetical protein
MAAVLIPVRSDALLFGHLLNGIANVDHDHVAHANIFVLQQEEAGHALDSTRFAPGLEAVDFNYFHGYAKAHVSNQPVGLSSVLTLDEFPALFLDLGHFCRQCEAIAY